MTDMQPVIGLEIHTHLQINTKLFCSCPSHGEEPNDCICEGCAGFPGALPRINEKAIELAVRAGLALGCTINEHSVFARKSYFYPDLPGGFQTSQLDPPICVGGGLTIDDIFIHLNRIHLEDDAGKCVHDEQRGQTLIDLNRSGAALIEIVTEPEFHSSTQVVNFLKKLHAILVHTGVTKGRMEEGEFRCDVNISLRPRGESRLGTRAEVKNLNSFRHVAQAIEYEILRQGSLYANGQSFSQETRLFDPVKQETRTLRSKENALDYRYFPQSDLPPVIANADLVARVKSQMPELPEQIKERLLGLGLNSEQVEVLLDRRGAVDYFDQAAAAKTSTEPQRLATLMLELLLPACQKEEILPTASKMKPAALASLGRLMADNAINRRVAYNLFPELFENGGDPEELAKAKGLMQISDTGAISQMATEIIAAHPEEARKYREGQEKIMSFFVGQLMRQSQGAANPKMAGEMLAKLLKN